jgi:hypothetical protein
MHILNQLIQKFDKLIDLKKIEIRDIKNTSPLNKYILEPVDFE